MGRTGAEGFAEAVADGDVSLRAAVHWNLTANHYPPLPSELVDVALEAIVFANGGDWDRMISMPEGIEFRDHDEVSVADAIETLHLGSFIESNEDW